jgi:hypothetical protein
MRETDKQPPGATGTGLTAGDRQEQRLAAALRANLARRKAQARRRREPPPASSAERKDDA